MLSPRPFLPILFALTSCYGQLTTDQKQFDFRSLSNLYAKRYGPAEWKRNVFGFDLLDVNPWLDRAANTTNDLEFYDLMVEYVASLRDSHSAYFLPSSFFATLGINADLYEGKVLIQTVNRTLLPQITYPFTTGDEIVSIDGRPIGELVDAYSKYAIQSNERSTRRRAIERVLSRGQSRNPRAAEIGASASVVVQRRGRAPETYNLPWLKSGLALTKIGPVGPGLRFAATEPDLLAELQHAADPDPSAVIGVGAVAPSAFALTTGFEQRLGKVGSDFFYSGVIEASGYRAGFIRIPSYDPLSQSNAISQFESEIAWMQANTDGLVVDQMRNPGGQLCYGETLTSYLMPSNFTPIGYEIRATWEYVQNFYNRLEIARAARLPAETVEQLQLLYDRMLGAYNSNKARTEAVPVCSPSFDRAPARDSKGSLLGYTKPLIMLIDEFSNSTADSVPAMIQDNKRGLLVGYRTNGAGGSNSLLTRRWQVGTWSEGEAEMTLSLMVRKEPVSTPEFPATRYIENVGVRPDVEIDIMTVDNLLSQGKPFVDAFTALIVKQIEAAKQQ